MSDYEKARDWWQASDHDRQDSLGDGLFDVLAEYANAERYALAAQLDEARVTLEDTLALVDDARLCITFDGPNPLKSIMAFISAFLAQPAPHADLIAAGMALANAYDDLETQKRTWGASNSDTRHYELECAYTAFRAAKEAAK